MECRLAVDDVRSAVMFVMIAEMEAGGERRHGPEPVGPRIMMISKTIVTMSVGTEGAEIEQLH